MAVLLFECDLIGSAVSHCEVRHEGMKLSWLYGSYVLPFGLYLSLSVVVNTKLKVGQFWKRLVCLLLVFLFSEQGSVVLRHIAWSSGDLIHGYGQVQVTSSGGMFMKDIWCHAWGPEVSDLKQRPAQSPG
jgi:hypothetical protein